ncbi:MAG: hypothetical protein PHS92_01635 [Candidatus Gracilibacteria bacterium]|nr:hypothetical protein [Candidatus Gracilibacteria bacterium]
MNEMQCESCERGEKNFGLLLESLKNNRINAVSVLDICDERCGFSNAKIYDFLTKRNIQESKKLG